MVQHKELLKRVWVGLVALANVWRIEWRGRIMLASTKISANTGAEAVFKQCGSDSMLLELDSIRDEADQAEAADREGNFSQTLSGIQMSTEHVRDILRRVRKKTGKKAVSPQKSGGCADPHTCQRREADRGQGSHWR